MPDPDDDTLVSLEVVLHPAGGADLTEVVITAERIADLTVATETLDRVRAWFAGNGFDVGPAGPISFSVTAPLSTIVTTFRVGSRTRRRLAAPPQPGAGAVTLPCDVLSADVRALVAAVVRPAVPAFGPGAP